MTIASIDIGSNTVLLLIAEIHTRKKTLEVLYEDQKIPRISQGLKKRKPFKKEKIVELISILKAYKKIAISYKCDKILVTATNAFRIASNSASVIRKIWNNLGLKVNVISGDEEARLMYIGSTFNKKKNDQGLVIDIGGGSTEMAFRGKDKTLITQSLPIGVVALREKFLLHNPPKNDELQKIKISISQVISKIKHQKINFNKLIAVAGTPTTLACIKRNLKNYDESEIEGDKLFSNDLRKFISLLSQMSSVEIKNKFKGVVIGREDVLLTGILILNEFMNFYNFDNCTVSTKGVRYGAIYDFVNKETKAPYFE